MVGRGAQSERCSGDSAGERAKRAFNSSLDVEASPVVPQPEAREDKFEVAADYVTLRFGSELGCAHTRRVDDAKVPESDGYQRLLDAVRKPPVNSPVRPLHQPESRLERPRTSRKGARDLPRIHLSTLRPGNARVNDVLVRRGLLRGDLIDA